MPVAYGSVRNPDSCCSRGYLKLGLGLIHPETVLPARKFKWPGLVKPGIRPRAPEGLIVLSPDIASAGSRSAFTLKSDAFNSRDPVELTERLLYWPLNQQWDRPTKQA
jgi:hypothetical protein